MPEANATDSRRGRRVSSWCRGRPTTVVRIGNRCWMTNDTLLPVSSRAVADTVNRQVNWNGLSTVISSWGKSTTVRSTDTLDAVGGVVADVGGDVGIVPARVTLGANGIGDWILLDTGGVCGLYGG